MIARSRTTGAGLSLNCLIMNYVFVFIVIVEYCTTLTLKNCDVHKDLKKKTCFFSHDSIKEGDIQSMSFCFKAKSSLRFLPIYISGQSKPVDQLSEFTPDSSYKLVFTVDKTDSYSNKPSYHYEINFENKNVFSGKFPLWNKQNQTTTLENLELVTASYIFTHINSSHSTNCDEELSSSSKDLGTAMHTENDLSTENLDKTSTKLTNSIMGKSGIVLLTVIILLAIGLACLVVAFMFHRNEKQATARAAPKEIPNLEVCEANQKRGFDDGPCYINVMEDEDLQKLSNLGDDDKVLYADVCFGDPTKMNIKKPRNTERKAIKVTKHPEKRCSNTEEKIYSTIVPEVQLENEGTYYANVGKQAMNNELTISTDGMVFYSNTNNTDF